MNKKIVVLLLFCLSFLGLSLSAQAEDHDPNVTRIVLKKHIKPRLRSSFAMVYDVDGHCPLYAKNEDTVTPIASISKLMMAMVVLDARLPLDKEITITRADKDRLKWTRSRMRPGTTLTRRELLKLALMASENRAAAALARTYPGGTEAAVRMMNIKARMLGMKNTHFLDPTGLNSGNVSTAEDLVKMVLAAKHYKLIREFTTTGSHMVDLGHRRPLRYVNTNPLVRGNSWDINLSKTGYISEAGRCLVMEATIKDRPVVIVLLDSWGKLTRVGDANRVRRWIRRALIVPTTNG